MLVLGAERPRDILAGVVTSRERLFFMSDEDERQFSQELRARLPSVVFIDDDRSAAPRQLKSLDEARSVQAWIARNDVPDQLLTEWSPSLPPLMQFLRSSIPKVRPGELRVGRLSIVFDREDALTGELIRVAWRTLAGLTTNKLVVTDESGRSRGNAVRDVWLAPGARALHERGIRLASNSAFIFYTLED